MKATAFKRAREKESIQKEIEYYKKQEEIQKRVANVLAEKRREKTIKRYTEDQNQETQEIADSEFFNEFEDHEAKLFRKMQKMKEIKMNKKKKKKLTWMYGNMSIY